MERVNQLIQLLTRATSDAQLTSAHISLYCVICLAWLINEGRTSFNVSRSKIMFASKIKSRATYHRLLNDLRKWGYVVYTPSYHPSDGSRISLLTVV